MNPSALKPFLTHTSLILLIVFSFGFCFNSCQMEKARPDISNIDVNLSFKRFEQDLFTLDSTNYEKSLDQLAQKYPDYFDFYAEKLMKFGKVDSMKSYQKAMIPFLQNRDIQSLYDTVQVKYPNLDNLKEELTTAFRYTKHYLPEIEVPKVYTHLAEFGPAAATYGRGILAINLDLYFGKNYPYYRSIGIPTYLSERFEPEYIVPNTMKAYFQELYPQPEKSNRLIDFMIQEGKLLYLLDLALPDTPDSLKIGYSAEQLRWCEVNEAMMWNFYVEGEWIFSPKYREFQKFLNEAPTTSGMPPGSPSKTAIWIGWQMVRKFMKENPITSIPELMKLQDGQMFLQQAAYKPRL
ncbi:MAG: hypothetical protein AB8B69_06700 [Chitinophagales bacterium]